MLIGSYLVRRQKLPSVDKHAEKPCGEVPRIFGRVTPTPRALEVRLRQVRFDETLPIQDAVPYYYSSCTVPTYLKYVVELRERERVGRWMI